jgi:hypothetical protein
MIWSLVSEPADCLRAGTVPEIALGDTIGRMAVPIKTAVASTPSAQREAGGPSGLPIGRPDLSLDDLLGFVVKPLRLTQGRVIDQLGRL